MSKLVRVPNKMYDFLQKKSQELGLERPSLYLRMIIAKEIKKEEEKISRGGDN